MSPLFRAVALALLAAALAGCASATRTARLDDPAHANRQVAGQLTTVVLADGTLYLADAVRVGRDSTSWVDPMTGTLRAVATASLAEVRRRDRPRTIWRAVRRGGVGGAVVGAVLGGVFGYYAGDLVEGTRAQDMVVVGLAGAVNGAVYGALAGLVIGAASDPTVRHVPAPPGEGPSETAVGGEPCPRSRVASAPADTRPRCPVPTSTTPRPTSGR